jgi:hypothetical protein
MPLRYAGCRDSQFQSGEELSYESGAPSRASICRSRRFWDLSGVVEGLGSGLTRLKVGDEVFNRFRRFMARHYVCALKTNSVIKWSNGSSG